MAKERKKERRMMRGRENKEWELRGRRGRISKMKGR